MNENCKYFRECFPELLIEPTPELMMKWQDHQEQCNECRNVFEQTTKEQENSLFLVQKLVTSIPAPPEFVQKKIPVRWSKYIVAAAVLILLSLQFYFLQMKNSPNLREKVTELLQGELPDEYIVSNTPETIDTLIGYGSKFYYDFEKLASLAEVYQNKLHDHTIIFAKARLLLNSRVYVHSTDQNTIKILIQENKTGNIKNIFSRAITNISVGEQSENIITDYFREALPYLLNLRLHQEELLEYLNQDKTLVLSQEQKRYIIWKIEQYFIKNIY